MTNTQRTSRDLLLGFMLGAVITALVAVGLHMVVQSQTRELVAQARLVRPTTKFSENVRRVVAEAERKAERTSAPNEIRDLQIKQPVAADVDDAEGIHVAVHQVTPPEMRMGWSQGQAEAANAKAIKAALPRFRIVGAPGDGKGKRVVLWDYARKVLGHDLPTFRQEIGDCVSMGAANGVNYLQVVEIARGESEEFHPAYQPWIYYTSRVLVGKGQIRCGEDGSVGSWAAEAVKKYGVLRADLDGVPPYSGAVAKKWGCSSTPPAKVFLDEATKHPIKTYAQVKSYADVRDAVVNGYPCTIASNVGFEGRKTTRDGRIFIARGGSWGHQMCVIGVDDTLPGGAAYIMNSWGETMFPVQPDGAPKGGFWVTGKDIDTITAQDDSFAFSGFDGFPSRSLDTDVLGWRVPSRRARPFLLEGLTDEGHLALAPSRDRRGGRLLLLPAGEGGAYRIGL